VTHFNTLFRQPECLWKQEKTFQVIGLWNRPELNYRKTHEGCASVTNQRPVTHPVTFLTQQSSFAARVGTELRISHNLFLPDSQFNLPPMMLYKSCN